MKVKGKGKDQDPLVPQKTLPWMKNTTASHRDYAERRKDSMEENPCPVCGEPRFYQYLDSFFRKGVPHD